MRGWLIVGVLVALAFGGTAVSRHPIPLPRLQNVEAQQTPNVPAKQHTAGAREYQTTANHSPQDPAKTLSAQPIGAGANLARDAADKPDQHADNPTEFWVLLGHRVKITDALMVAVTTLLTVATGALIIVGRDQAFQLRATIHKIDEVGRLHAGHMAASAKAMGRAADAMRDVASAMEKQAGLAHQNYLAAFRPRMKVRFMRMDPLKEGVPITVRYNIINAGDNPGNVFASHAIILLLNEPDTIYGVPWFEPAGENKEVVPLERGESRNRIITNDTLTLGADISNIDGAAKFLHVIGYLMYRDHNNAVRRTGFFRRYDSARRRFRVVDDADYEYED